MFFFIFWPKLTFCIRRLCIAMDAPAATSDSTVTDVTKNLICIYCSGPHDDSLCVYNCSQDHGITWKGQLKLVLKQHLKQVNQKCCSK